MIHAICNFCGKDCDRTAIMLAVTPFSNFARYPIDLGPYGSASKTRNYVICNECYEKRKLPNPFHEYKTMDKQQLRYGKYFDNYTTEDIENDERVPE